MPALPGAGLSLSAKVRNVIVGAQIKWLILLLVKGIRGIVQYSM